MKKLLLLGVVFVLAISMVSCSKEEDKDDYDFAISTGDIYSQSDSALGKIESEEQDDASADSEWKKFIKEYDEWVDDYIDFMDKYKKNPTDISILSEYADMMSDLTDWSSRADEVAKELENSPEESLEYAAELAKIAAKIAEAAY